MRSEGVIIMERGLQASALPVCELHEVRKICPCARRPGLGAAYLPECPKMYRDYMGMYRDLCPNIYIYIYMLLSKLLVGIIQRGIIIGVSKAGVPRV